MSSASEHITLIHAKLQQLLRQYDQLQKASSAQQKQIAQLEQQLEQSRLRAEQLAQQNLLLKASVTDMDAADKKALEQKIQHYIKNIDRCIAMLSQ